MFCKRKLNRLRKQSRVGYHNRFLIFGFLLSLFYINDLAPVFNVLLTVLFADMNLYLSGNNADELIEIMNNELIKMIEWLDFNKLSLNVLKTLALDTCFQHNTPGATFTYMV